LLKLNGYDVERFSLSKSPIHALFSLYYFILIVLTSQKHQMMLVSQIYIYKK